MICTWILIMMIIPFGAVMGIETDSDIEVRITECTDLIKRDPGNVDVQAPTHDLGLIGHYADRLSVYPAVSGHQVGGKVRLILEKISIVNYGQEDIMYVVGLVGIIGDEVIERLNLSVYVGGRSEGARLLHVVRRQKTEQFTNTVQALLVST